MSSPLCVYELGLMCSQTQLCHMFRPLLAIFRLSWRTNLKSYYMYCARAWCRDLYVTGFILYKMMWMRACRLSGPMVVLYVVRSFSLTRCAVWGAWLAWSLAYVLVLVCPRSSVLSLDESGFVSSSLLCIADVSNTR